MKILHLPLLIFCLFYLAACGKEPNSDKKTATITPDQIGNLLENQTFECSSADGGPCPVGISRLFILNIDDPNQTELCSGFLASTNRLVTNHHCVSSQAQCDNTYVAIYTGTSYEVARCQTLVKAETDGRPLDEKAIDYAVIELDRHVRTVESFSLAKKSPKLGEELTAWVVDHVDLFTGRITELNCTLTGNKNSLQLENCPAISGNSGSPVVNETGFVVGVLWGSTTNAFINEDTDLEERRELNDEAYVTEVKHFKAALSLDERARLLRKVRNAYK